MNEQTRKAIDRARLVLKAAPNPMSEFYAVSSVYVQPGVLTTLCDALEAAERRAEEARAEQTRHLLLTTVADLKAQKAEAQSAAGRVAIRMLMEDHDPHTYSRCEDRECDHARLAISALGDDAGRALLARLHAAEAERDALRGIIADCAAAIGNGSSCTSHASVEFMAMIPAEIRAETSALRAGLAAAEARVADLESVREEQAAKLRRHLDEIAELQDRAGLAEGREAAAKANAEEMAGWLGARNAGLVQMARDRDALRVKLYAAEAKIARLEGQKALTCRCVSVGMGYVPGTKVVAPFCDYSVAAVAECPDWHGSGAVIVEGAALPGVMIPDELPRVAPVQGEWKKRPAGTVPWIVHLEAFNTYRKLLGNGQSAERIAERGGFSYREMQCLLAGHYSHECKVEHDAVPGWVEKLA